MNKALERFIKEIEFKVTDNQQNINSLYLQAQQLEEDTQELKQVLSILYILKEKNGGKNDKK